MKQKRSFFLPIAAFIGVAVLLSGLYLMTMSRTAEQARQRYRSIATHQASEIRGRVDTILAHANTLEAMIIADEGQTESFEQVAKQIYHSTAAETGVPLRSIALAPNGVIEQVYPLADNEALIGTSLPETEKLSLSDPFSLPRGGTGMTGQMPIYYTENDEERLWGYAAVIMDFDKLMKAVDLEYLSVMGTRYRLWYKGADGTNEILAGSRYTPENPISHQFKLCNLTWNLDVAPSRGWVNYTELAVGFAIILSVSLLLALLLLAQESIRTANKQLKRLAHLDGLTSCYSRHYVSSILVDQRSGSWNDPHVKYSLAMLDIDLFKGINDRYGHETGDRAIVAVAQVLLDHIKKVDGDCIIRYGGDEFILLFNDVTRERFLGKLEDILEAARQIRFTDCPDLRLTVSIGGEFYSTPKHSYYEMVRRADEKLYYAKENGRDRFAV